MKRQAMSIRHDSEMSNDISIACDVPAARARERTAGVCMRILVVEDDPLIAFPLAWELERLGHQVLGPTRNACAALELAKHSLPHLVLVDMNLQGPPDGIAFAKALKEELNIRSVFLSAQRGDALAHREIALGLMTKPYLPESVPHCLESLRALLEGRHASSIPHLMETFQLDAIGPSGKLGGA